MTARERVGELRRELDNASPRQIVARALEVLGPDGAISFSGSEDVLLIEYAKQSKIPFRVFSIDTGRLHPETYRYFATVEEHYNIRIEYCFPEAARVQQLVRAKGMFSFYEDGHRECCSIRKVEPLARQLAGLDGWITGQRRDQSPGTRSSLELVELDQNHAGKSGGPLLKVNPLAHVSLSEVWEAIRAFGAPHNPLHEKGFVSIGCEPCTRPILPGEHERAGRWWWEEETKKECGLHR